MKTAQLNLIYDNPGEDFETAMDAADNNVLEALENQAQLLEMNIEILRKVKEAITLQSLDKIILDSVERNLIFISGPDDLIDNLIAQGLATPLDSEGEPCEDGIDVDDPIPYSCEDPDYYEEEDYWWNGGVPPMHNI